MTPKILVLDDEPLVLGAFENYLSEFHHNLVLHTSPDKALEEFRKSPQDYACAFIDYIFINEMKEREALGHRIAEDLKNLNHNIYTIIMSGDESKEALEVWLSSTVDKFIYKPFKGEQVHTFAEYSLARHQESCSYLDDEVINYHGLVGASQNIKWVANMLKKVAPTDETLLITGETGTGKEIIAKAAHNTSKRSKGPFVAINCAAIAKDLIDSTLFGHTRGAFTGAVSDRLGKFREAHGGTLFLDEIHHLTKEQQAKLLRVIEERIVCPVGSEKEIKVDFRLICASKPELKEQSRQNEFLPDLFYRISSLDIHVTPLRERASDIPHLIKFFQKNINENTSIKKIKTISSPAMRHLQKYHWYGNVRELKRVIESLYISVDHNHIESYDLPQSIFNPSKEIEINNSKMKMRDLEGEQRKQKINLIQSAIEQAKNNQTLAAKILGMKRTTLISTIEKLGI